MQTLENPTTTPNLPSGEKNSEPKKEFTLLSLRELWFRSPTSESSITNCDDASEEEFREFINSYVVLSPTVNLDSLLERRDILNFIFSGDGPKPEFLSTEVVVEEIEVSEAEVQALIKELFTVKPEHVGLGVKHEQM